MRVILGHECADLEVKIGHLGAVVDYLMRLRLLNSAARGWAGCCWHLTALLFDSFGAENVVF